MHVRTGNDYKLYDRSLTAGHVELQVQINTPADPSGWVIIGYSRHYRQPVVPVDSFNNANLATMYVHLFPPKTSDALLESDIHAQLTQQMIDATRWLCANLNEDGKPIGLFGAHQDAGFVLSAAAFLGREIGAVVSYQGRPDRAMNHLPAIEAPTLLIVNEADSSALTSNAQACWWLRCHYQLSVVPGRLRLLRESSILKQAEELSGEWYRRFLLGRRPLKGWTGPLAAAMAEEIGARFS